MTLHARCIDGQGYQTDHDAEGWIVSPEGKRIAPMCRKDADRVIEEYETKLGECWKFEPAELAPSGVGRPGD